MGKINVSYEILYAGEEKQENKDPIKQYYCCSSPLVLVIFSLLHISPLLVLSIFFRITREIFQLYLSSNNNFEFFEQASFDDPSCLHVFSQFFILFYGHK